MDSWGHDHCRCAFSFITACDSVGKAFLQQLLVLSSYVHALRLVHSSPPTPGYWFLCYQAHLICVVDPAILQFMLACLPAASAGASCTLHLFEFQYLLRLYLSVLI